MNNGCLNKKIILKNLLSILDWAFLVLGAGQTDRSVFVVWL